jgi:hypothetical protein
MQRWLPGDHGRRNQADGGYYKRAWDEQVPRRYRSGELAPGMSRERFLRLLDAAEYIWPRICMRFPSGLSLASKAARRPAPPVRPSTRQFRTYCSRRERLASVRFWRRFTSSSRRKPRRHSACRPACIPMRYCRSVILWDGLGRSAVSLPPVSSLRTDGSGLPDDKSQGGDYACSGVQMALALAGAEPHRGAYTRIEAGGFAGIWVGDSLGHTLDPLTKLAALAAVTATLRDNAAHDADLHGT